MHHTSKIIVNKAIADVFEQTLTVKLSTVFKDWGKYAGVKSATIEENWATVGQTRRLQFTDNTYTKETLTQVQHPTYFAYQVTNFTDFQLRIGLNSIDGSWDFVDLGNNQTEVTWTYKANPKHFIARLMLKKVIKNDLPHIMAQGLSHLKLVLEK